MKQIKSKKLLIEQHDRVGGRAFSLNITYLDKTITFEHGAAMRHRWNDWFYKMVNYLNICDNMVKMDSSTNNMRKERYFRNIYKNNSIDDATFYDQFVYNLRAETDKFRFADLREEFWMENNNGLPPQTEQEMFDCLENWTFRGKKLLKYNLYSIYKNIFNVSVEYINQRKDSQFPPFFDNRLDFCEYNKFRPWTSSRPSDVDGGQWTLRNGYNLMTQRLYEKLNESKYNTFNFNEELMSIHYNNNKGKRNKRNKRKRKCKENKRYSVTTRNFGDFIVINEYYTDNIVLAIPPYNLRKILNNIDPFCEVIGNKNGVCYKIKEKMKELVIDSKNNVEFGYKVNLIYDNYWEWMDQLNITDFIQSITDLDIRSFYIDDNWRNDNLFAIQFYSRVSQAQQLHFLQQSVGDDLYQFDENVIVSHYGRRDIKYTASSKQQIQSVLKELANLFNLTYNDPLINKPLAAFAHSFGLNDTGMDGIYVWSVNTNSWNVINNILKPLNNENIYIISVDYSRAIADHGGAIYAAVQNTIHNLNMINPLENTPHCATL